VFEPRAPELSHLALAPGGGDDGRLEVHEIHALDFTGTRLVVLSACQGATGELGGGDEIVGLVRPFLATGAAAVVASLWNVDDRATARWMGGFYESLAQGAPVAEAVRAGRAAVRRSSLYRHPYFWAAFQLYGAP
jgi:CHAT domain-containing protein